ncbi:MAG: hypothetical protein LBM92_03170, partial [Opitutaceae bacterium]|nr:hypothetical protein [Opitutaceae bacterium]
VDAVVVGEEKLHFGREVSSDRYQVTRGGIADFLKIPNLEIPNPKKIPKSEIPKHKEDTRSRPL